MKALLLLLLAGLPGGGDPPALDCRVVFAPAGTTTEGSGYTALVAGADGRVYVGSARYGAYGWLLELDPREAELKKIACLKEITGESLRGINSQAKIHSKMSIGSDGKVYFASKQGHEVFDTRPEFEDGAGYPGGHLCIYDPRSGEVRDLGIPRRGEGLMWSIIDEARRRIYLRSEPKNHFLYYDLATGSTTDLGNTGTACRYLALDPRGVAYTAGRGQTICRMDPEKDFLEDLPVVVSGEGGYQSPYVLVIAPDGRRLYGMTGGHAFIIEYDLERAGETVAARNVARVIPGDLPNKDVHAAVFGRDGRLYYPVQTTGDVLHLLRFDTESRQVEDLGIPKPAVDDARNRRLYVHGDLYRLDSIQGATVGPDGTLYLLDIYPQLNVVVFPGLTRR